MVTARIKNASKLPNATGRGNDRQRRVLLMPDRNIAHHITVWNILSLTYIMHGRTNNHIHVLSPHPHPLLKTTLYELYCCCWWLLASPCPSFYDLLFLEYIPNALWMDAVLWALVFTLHLKCGCLWNGLEWNGKKSLCLIFASYQLQRSLQFHLPVSLFPWRLMIKCRAFEMVSSLCFHWLFKIVLITTTEISNFYHWNETKWSAVGEEKLKAIIWTPLGILALFHLYIVCTFPIQYYNMEDICNTMPSIFGFKVQHN